MPDVVVVAAAVLAVVAAAVLRADVVAGPAGAVVVAAAVLAVVVAGPAGAVVVAGPAGAFVVPAGAFVVGRPAEGAFVADVLDTRDAAAFFVAADFSTTLDFFPAAAFARGLPGSAAFVATDRLAAAEARLTLGRADGIPARPFSRTGPRNWPV